ncbi:centrosomal protein of 152 kDa isoform X2 [Crotalus tigris]|uniref:centrosomal protein of 152 kDa isoform X2 n=1 Tax=Crotalus tigris TaxID=88082 RepID=UPI00192F9C00|nr:centrosomal protein of 152 kDa isoform X2 [Crotalus tigris]
MMSLDFDSAALQMQHEEDEYDQEDYAREQELQQLLTDLPHDMLEDSGDQLSDYSAPEEHEQGHEPWDQDAAQWNDHPVATNPPSDYGQDQNVFVDRFVYDQGNIPSEMRASDWPFHHREAEDKSLLEISSRASENGSEGAYFGEDYKAASHYPQNGIYDLPPNFRAFTNGLQQDFSNQHGLVANFVDPPQEPLKLQYGGSETNGQSLEPYKVVYKAYQKSAQKAAPISSEAAAFEEMQQEFLATGESSSENMKILQLQILNKAKERTLGELNNQLEERAQQIRYLSHQLAIMKDEKDGMYLSLQESQKLYQNSKEREVQLEGQIKALESQIQTLAANEEQLIKQSKVAEVAMESLQQQLLELRRSDALQRAREQHEAIVAALRQKLEEQASSLQQKLDVKNASLQEQIEMCCHLKEHVKQLERTLEESKLEKNEIINRLSRSLEESQNQCANLLQTGLVTETNQLRLQLQQAHSAQLLGNEMNKALQEEIKELKEEIVLYESATKHGVFLNDPGGNLNVELTDSYVDLGIKQINKKTTLQSCSLNKETDKGLSKDEIVSELKVEMQRLLNSNKSKRNRISRLQNDLEDCHKTIEELKQQLVKSNTKGKNMESPSDSTEYHSSDEMLKLKKENQELQQEIESHNACIQELLEGKEQLKNANQDLCNQMRQMVQDSDRDKQEALDRCERTYRQHYEDTKKKLLEESAGKHVAEKEKLIHAYEENIAQLKLDIDDLNKEMIVVKECYLAVCKEKDEQAAVLKAAFEQEQHQREEKLLVEKEDSLNRLRNELEETHKNVVELTKNQWQKESEADIRQRLDKEVELAKNIWEKAQKEAQEQACQEVEKEWQQRLAQALEETKRTTVELKDHGSQTDETLCQVIAGAVEEQTLSLREALKAKERSLREQEASYHESIATQVEAALTKARALWLQELTDLEEYKNHLKAAKEKWEKESEISTAEKVSAAEERWKKQLENSDKAQRRINELEEKALSLRRELELKQDEIPSLIEAELAKAHSQWIKEKEGEMLSLQDQNEKERHALLQDQKVKLGEMFAKAKEDFENQKKELLDQKEAELKTCLVRKQQEWAVQEAKRLQNEVHHYEDRILVQVELLLDDLHKDLVQCASCEGTWETKWSASPPLQINRQFKDKLAFCLQKAYRSTVSAILGKATKKWNQKHEHLGSVFKDSDDSCMQNGEGEPGDKFRPSAYNIGQQVELQRILRKHPPLEETERDLDCKCRKRNMSSQDEICFEHYRQQLEKKEKECEDLKKKLDKACRHLQLAVKEQKTKSEQAQENEKIMKALLEENSAMKNQLDDLKCVNIPPRSSSEGCVSRPCCSCNGKALEEMRSQYLKTVSKIKSDMLRYIHESKERAAEIIKAEVLRERQETARKMRKYYLICLQQLLVDNGKHEGAEKKIICAAGKIATMAKILETPVRNSALNKTPHSVLPQSSKAEESKASYTQHSKSTPKENQTHDENTGKKHTPRSLQPQLDAASESRLVSQTQMVRKAFKQLDESSVGAAPAEAFSKEELGNKDLPCRVGTFQNASSYASQGKLQSLHPAAGDGSDFGTAGEKYKCLSERPRITEVGSQTTRQWKAKSGGTPGFEVQETPVRDEESSADWSLLSEALHVNSSGGFQHPGQKIYSRGALDSHSALPTTNTRSQVKEEASGFSQRLGGRNEKELAKNQNINCTESQLTVSSSCIPKFAHLDAVGPARAHPNNAVLCSAAGKNYHSLQSRRHIHRVMDCQQDSGFDSPQINFD